MSYIEVDMKPISQILKNHGLDSNGRVQLYVTNMINRRITRYMPFRTGMLATKLKYVASPTEIVVNPPYAKYQYYGKAMVNSKTGKGPAFIPNVGYRFPRNSTLMVTARDLKYDKTKNPEAGPFWDRRMMAKEKAQMAKEVQDYINRTG